MNAVCVELSIGYSAIKSMSRLAYQNWNNTHNDSINTVQNWLYKDLTNTLWMQLYLHVVKYKMNYNRLV